MTAHWAPPLAIDLLADAIERARPKLACGIPVRKRLYALWAAAGAAERLGAWGDVVAEEFLALAVATGLVADLGWHGREDVEHVVRWALLGLNPFH
jgi:hypothetical protein